MRISSPCWHSAIWRFPPRSRNAFTNSHTPCRLELEPPPPQKNTIQTGNGSFGPRTGTRDAGSGDASPLSSLHRCLPPFRSLCVGICASSLHLLKKTKNKNKNCHGSSTSHTETSAHATLFSNQATFSSSSPNKAAAPLSTKRAHFPRP